MLAAAVSVSVVLRAAPVAMHRNRVMSELSSVWRWVTLSHWSEMARSSSLMSSTPSSSQK